MHWFIPQVAAQQGPSQAEARSFLQVSHVGTGKSLDCPLLCLKDALARS